MYALVPLVFMDPGLGIWGRMFSLHQDLSSRDANECVATFEGLCRPSVIVLSRVSCRLRRDQIRLHRTIAGGRLRGKESFCGGLVRSSDRMS